MANPFQQKVRLRKLIYAGMILVLITLSLMHRKQFVEAAAESLQLRETTRGEVELTGSALRLMLTGSRGFVVTYLWYVAREEQDKHKWNEVELLVNSITKLQPYFVTPWLFQSWNMAFNVSVEWDKPRDKYYYISRGLQLLAEGERRNRGSLDSAGKPRFPGNPDLRYNMAFFYQLKMAQSDEKNAMQCLLDMSCIDPVERDAERFWKPGKYGREVGLDKFRDFCIKYPRLVRRLHDHLECTEPARVVEFLKDNQVIPGRFSEKKRFSGESILEDPKKQFPVLPPSVVPDERIPTPLRGYWPNSESVDLTSEAFDVFVVARAWFTYAQFPLPPEVSDPEELQASYDPVKHRIPRNMTTMIFRGAPARTQSFLAEFLEKEGFYDKDGWVIKDWFGNDLVVGAESKYHAQPAWKKANEVYLEFGRKNGLYLSAAELKDLNEQAKLFRETYRVTPGDKFELRSDQRVGEMAKSYKAHLRLLWYQNYRGLTNFNSLLAETEAEKDPRGVLSRKWFFKAMQDERAGAPARALASYEKSINLWKEVLSTYKDYQEINTVQEDSFEMEWRYIRLWQREKAAILRPLVQGIAELAARPCLACVPTGVLPCIPAGLLPCIPAVGLSALVNEHSFQQRIIPIPIRMIHGPLDNLIPADARQTVYTRKTGVTQGTGAMPRPAGR
jgi:hypothetical protein